MLGVTKGRVSQMVKANQLEAFRDGGTVWVTLDSIEARLAEKPKVRASCKSSGNGISARRVAAMEIKKIIEP